MDRLFNFLKEFMPILDHYPAWAKYLFGISLLFALAAIFIFVILFPSALAKKKTLEAEAAISLAVSLLDDTQAATSGVSLEGECQQVLQHEQSSGYVTIRHILGADGQQIEPFSPYQSRLLQGQPVGPIRYTYQSATSWCPPNLDLRVKNNSDKEVFLEKVVFEIEESQKDFAPLILFEEDPLKWNALHIRLVNQGWCKIENCLLKCNLTPIKIEDHHDLTKAWNYLDKLNFAGPYKHAVPVQNFEISTNVSLIPAFIDEGVKVNAERMSMEANERYKLEDFDAYEPKKSDLKQFATGSALAYGELQFSTSPSNPGSDKHIIKFATVVHLANRFTPGASMPSSFLYKTQFQPDYKNYSISVPISLKPIPPKEADRFNIQVSCKQSSHHKFRVRLVYSQNNSVVSEPLDMRIMVPRVASQEPR